jgi:hypothetical protein
MSLQLLAKQMEAKGRKGDSMLVHMTPGEVAGLQKLAEAAGGSLSVNPETGLVEANFLKRMLPTLVGLGVGAATMNPYAGAAAGAAVGGYQARRNDQDVLLGAAMGGLGGYGGASMGAGLTAAGAPTVANVAAPAATVPSSVGTSIMNPATMGTTAGPGITLQGVAPAATTGVTAAPLTASQGLSQAGQGISALGTNAGARTAFMSKVGGGAGLASDIGMATAPMMAPGKKPGEAPVDDEMYSYEYNPGRTGAERSPMASTSERTYFDGSYSPLRKIKASQYGMAQGGLMSLAEGGTTTAPSGTSSEGMTGASKAAFDYLMGRSEDSGFAGQGPGRGGSGTFSGGDGMYSFDPATGQFTRNPNYRDPEDIERERLAAEAAAAAAAQAAADRERGDREEDERRRRAEEEEARRRAIPNITPPRQGSILARSPAVIVGGPIADPTPIRGTPPLGEPGGRDDRPYNSSENYDGSQNPNVTVDGPIDTRPPQGYDLDTGAPVHLGDYGLNLGGGGGGGGIDYGGYSPTSDDASYGGFFAAGGLMGLAKGGMRSGGFVIPADVVSMIGEGNTDAGYKRIKSIIPGATAIKGKDGGQSDTVKTSIEGKQPARVAHGEMYIPPETVKRMGGAKKLYAMMDRVRQQATGSKKQIKPVSLKRAMA